MKLNHSLWLAALLALILFSCNKELPEDLVANESEQIEEARAALKTPEEVNFFDFNYLSATNTNIREELSFRDEEQNNLVLEAIDRILLQNADHGFVPGLVSEIGYPIWDRGRLLYNNSNQNQVLLIPFAKANETSIRAFLLVIPSSSSDWFFLLADKAALLSWLPGVTSVEDEREAKEFFALNYLAFDEELFGHTDPTIKNWLAQNGDNFGTGENDQEINSRCVMIVSFSYCAPNAFRPDDEDGHINSRGCGAGFTEINTYAIFHVNCGGGFGSFGSGNGIGNQGGWWDGIGINGPGSGCIGCPGNPWNDPAVAQQMQRCELISDIANNQVPGDLNQFSQAEIDLCSNLGKLMNLLVLGPDDVSYLIENPDELSILVAYFSSGVATPADHIAAAAFLRLSQEEKISMAWREFRMLHLLVFGELGPELGLTVLEKEWLLEHGEIAQELDTFLDEVEGYDDPEELLAAKQAALSVIKLHQAGLFYGPYDSNYEAVLLNAAPGLEVTNPYLMFSIGFRAAELRLEYPNASNLWIYATAVKDVLLDSLHISLDVIGLVPGIGEFADLANGFIYTIEGDGINATLSFAATIPFAGWSATGVKWARKTIIGVSGRKYKLNFIVEEGTNLIKFGDRGQLNRILKTPAAHQAHHIIPWEHGNHILVQKAAQGGSNASAFHLNDLSNGINMPNTRHSGSHPNYSNLIRQRMDDWHAAHPNATPDQVSQSLVQWGQQIKTLINSSSGNINNIIPPPIP